MENIFRNIIKWPKELLAKREARPNVILPKNNVSAQNLARAAVIAARERTLDIIKPRAARRTAPHRTAPRRTM